MTMGQLEYPYNGYNGYKSLSNKDGRYYVSLVPNGTVPGLKRSVISYARYLMSVKEARILRPEEQVDHIDNDKTHDVIENLQILSIAENNRKQGKVHGAQMVYLHCPWCGKMFFKDIWNTHLAKPTKFTACSRSCVARFAALMMSYPNDPKVVYGINNNVFLRYTRH